MNKVKEKISTFFWTLKNVFKINPIRFILNIIMTVINSFIPVYMTLLTGKVLDIIVNNLSEDGTFEAVIQQTIILGLMILFNAFLMYGQGLISNALNMKIGMKLNRRFIKVVDNIPLKKFDDSKFCDEFEVAKEGFMSIISSADNIYDFGGQIISLISALIIVLNIYPYMCIPFALSFVIGYILNMSSSRQEHQYWEESTGDRRYNGYVTNLFLSKKYAKEVRNYNLLSYLWTPLSNVKRKLREDQYAISKKSGIRFAWYQLLMDIFSLIILVISIILTGIGIISLGSVLVLWQLCNQVLIGVQTVSASYASIYYDNEKCKKAKDFIKIYEKEIEYKASAIEINATSPDAIIMKNVNFAYIEGIPVIHDMSVTIPKGQTVAIVGENGSGKSTMIKLITGLYKPDSGGVYFNGHDTQATKSDKLTIELGITFQDYICFPYSLRENIGFGDLRYLNDDPKIIEAAKKGDALHIINRFKALDKVLSKSLDPEGTELSGGEWQRIALSRANMNDKPILILDEPAAKLDPIAEFKQFQQIRDNINGRTALLISHRIGFARLASRILVLKGGQIAEDGTHEQLMELKGIYYTMFNEQAKWYDIEWVKGK